jgi:nitrogen regulatory protein P-II 1
MKRITAYIRTNKLEEVKEALEELELYGMSVEQVRGFGRQQGQTAHFRGSNYAMNLIPKMKIDVVVVDEMLEPAIQAIMEAARTGDIGDGKIFVSEVIEVVRVRTGERNDAAL